MFLYLWMACHPNTPPFHPEVEQETLFQGLQPQPNLLMISIDTLRRSALGRYGGGTDTPFLDQLAEQGVVMDRHQTCSAWTYPGIVCTLTGQMPYTFGFMPRPDRALSDMSALPSDVQTIATHLHAAGMQTFLITTSNNLGPTHGTDVGYDWEYQEENLANQVTDRALELVKSSDFNRQAPWFLHVHFKDTHFEYNPPEAYKSELEGRQVLPWDLSSTDQVEQFLELEPMLSAEIVEEAHEQLRILYRGEVRFIDDELKRMITTLQAEDLMENTLIVVWTDHGEQFWEHGAFEHTNSLHSEENDGILFFSGAGLSPASWTGWTSSQDLLPTLLSLLNLPPAVLPGQVIGMALSDAPSFGVLLPHSGPPMQSISRGEKKLIYDWGGSFKFYNRDDDFEEQHDIYEANNPDVQEAIDLLRPEIQKLQPMITEYQPQGLP